MRQTIELAAVGGHAARCAGHAKGVMRLRLC